jgi:hypothetical protein
MPASDARLSNNNTARRVEFESCNFLRARISRVSVIFSSFLGFGGLDVAFCDRTKNAKTNGDDITNFSSKFG